MGKGWCDVCPQRTRLSFGFLRLRRLGENPSRNASMRVHVDGHTERDELVL